jgi:hypothetical protein
MKMLGFIMHIRELFEMLQIPMIVIVYDCYMIRALNRGRGSDFQFIDLAKNEIFQQFSGIKGVQEA